MILLGAIVLAVFWLSGPWDVIVVGAAAIVELAETGFWVWLSKRRRAAVGAETLVGAAAVVVTPCRPLGQVRVRGELWQARCDAGAGAGARVTVQAVEGLTLVVAPA